MSEDKECWAYKDIGRDRDDGNYYGVCKIKRRLVAPDECEECEWGKDDGDE